MFRNKQVDDILKEGRKPVYTYNTKEIKRENFKGEPFISQEDKFRKETKDSIENMEKKLTETMQDHQQFIHENYIKKKTFNNVVFSLVALNVLLLCIIIYLIIV